MFKRFTAGVAVGYVLGARAGQKRYDQITKLADQAMEIPMVERMATSGRTLAMDSGRKLLASLKERAHWDDDIGQEESGDKDDEEDDSSEIGANFDSEEDEGPYDEEGEEGEGPYDEEGEEDEEGEGPYDEEGEGPYDEEDEGPYDEEDEGPYDEEEDGGDERPANDKSDADVDDDYEGSFSDDESGDDVDSEDEDTDAAERGSHSRRGIGSLASAARERGRVA